MTELDKLAKYLKDNHIPFERYDCDKQFDDDDFTIKLDRHQICVPKWGENCKWDAICQEGSYGYERGLLEIYGELVPDEEEDSVIGFLTAEQVIERIKPWHEKIENRINEQIEKAVREIVLGVWYN